MELTPEQINRFIEIHKGQPEFEKYSEAEVWEIANGVASYYLIFIKISRGQAGMRTMAIIYWA